MWRAYLGMNTHKYVHNMVNHSKFWKDPNTGVHTYTIEGLWNGAKIYQLHQEIKLSKLVYF